MLNKTYRHLRLATIAKFKCTLCNINFALNSLRFVSDTKIFKMKVCSFVETKSLKYTWEQ